MDAREERGLQIANTAKIVKTPVGYKVPSQSGNGTYIVNLDHGHQFCTCPDFEARQQPCKHIHAVEFTLQRESKPDGSVTVTQSMKVTCTQEWPAYNQAQTNEEARFVQLLRDLCAGIPQPEYTFGRPRLALSDVVFGLVFKSYTTFSGRRLTTALREAQADGLISKAAHYNSAYNYLEKPELTPILKSLIEQSASPLKAVESDFAVDASGFATSVYDRWYDHKYGKERSEAKWVKAHLMCGVTTHVVTSVEISDSADTVQLPALVNTTAKTFKINEVSADKGYSSKNNLKVVARVGGVAYIPFRMYGRPELALRDHMDGTLWNRMWHFYNFNRDAFYAHYHKRSNVESTFSMIKAKFGTRVRAKTPAAQVNEVLCKVLCHNICVLIQSIYELGLEPTFWAETAVSQKVGVQ